MSTFSLGIDSGVSRSISKDDARYDLLWYGMFICTEEGKEKSLISIHIGVFYACMDDKKYEEADKVLTEIEDIVGTTDPDIAAARTSLDLELLLGE